MRVDFYSLLHGELGSYTMPMPPRVGERIDLWIKRKQMTFTIAVITYQDNVMKKGKLKAFVEVEPLDDLIILE